MLHITMHDMPQEVCLTTLSIWSLHILIWLLGLLIHVLVGSGPIWLVALVITACLQACTATGCQRGIPP